MRTFVMMGFVFASLAATFAGLIFAAHAMAHVLGAEGRASGKTMCISGLTALIFAAVAIWLSRAFWLGL
jgi:hypothetical protein